MGDEIIHLNIRGLNGIAGNNKVLVIQSELDKHCTKVLNIHETRLSNSNFLNTIFSDYTNCYNIIFSNVSNNDAGGGIIMCIKMTEEIITKTEIIKGRLLYIKTKNKVTENFSNYFSFYGKSNADHGFVDYVVSSIENKVTEEKLENIFILGDFNFVTSTLDRKSNTFIPADNLYRHKWTNLELKIHILDPFRKLYPTRRLYSFFQAGKLPKSRLDRVYISNDISGKVDSVKFDYNPESDHKILRVRLYSDIEKGRGTWIFNNSLLRDQLFINEIRKIINIYQNSREEYPDSRCAWDFFKMEIASFSKYYSRKIARINRENIDRVKHELEILQSLKEGDISQTILSRITVLKNQINDDLKNKLEGAKLRSKIPHMEEGDYNISYYARLEKRRSDENSIFSLEDNEGIIKEGSQNVLRLSHDFYQHLYSKEDESEELQDFFLGKIDKILSEEGRLSLARLFTREELKDAIMNMQNNKSPGNDGLTKEFYDFFWADLEEFFFQVTECIYRDNDLSTSQKRE